MLTPLSDVEDEINGLVTYDRRIVKVEEAVMQDISRRINDKFSKSLKFF